MISTSEVVLELIKQKPFLEEALSEGLVNYSALARILRPQVEEKLMKQTKEGAIMMALKRTAHDAKKSFPSSKNILKSFGDIIIRSNLVDYTFQVSPTLIDAQNKLVQKTSAKKEAFVTISHGVSQLTVIASQSVEDIIKALFAKETVVCVIKDLSSITILITKEATEIPGVLYFILKILAWNGINIIECISTFTELTIILHSKDIDRAFSLIKKQTEVKNGKN